MKKLLRYICIGVGLFFLMISAGGFLDPIMDPYSYPGHFGNEAFAAGILTLPLGLLFRVLSLVGKPIKERLIHSIRDYFIISVLTVIPGFFSLFYSFSLPKTIAIILCVGGYFLFDNLLDRVRKQTVQ